MIVYTNKLTQLSSLKDYVRAILGFYSYNRHYNFEDQKYTIQSILLTDYVLQRIGSSGYKNTVYDDFTFVIHWRRPHRTFLSYKVAVDIVDDDDTIYEGTKRLLNFKVQDDQVYNCKFDHELAIHLWYRPGGPGMLEARDNFHSAGCGTAKDGNSGGGGKSMFYKNPFVEEVHYGVALFSKYYFTTFCEESTYYNERDDPIVDAKYMMELYFGQIRDSTKEIANMMTKVFDRDSAVNGEEMLKNSFETVTGDDESELIFECNGLRIHVKK